MRWLHILGLMAIALPASARADQFDLYLNPVLRQAIDDKKVKEVTELTSDGLSDAGGVLSDTTATVLIVETNDHRLSKLLVRSAGQKVGADGQIGMLLVEKFVTFKETSDRAIKATGANVHLYTGMRLELDIGQVVPEKLGGDLIVSQAGDDPLSIVVKPVNKAKLYVLTKALPGLAPKKGIKLVVGEKFETRYFAGKYKLSDDGRRSGTLNLEVNEAGEVSGSFYSDKDGQKYEVKGKVGTPSHQLTFTIEYPQVKQTFTGMLFTGNGKAIVGTSKLQERETGFSAEREE